MIDAALITDVKSYCLENCVIEYATKRMQYRGVYQLSPLKPIQLLMWDVTATRNTKLVEICSSTRYDT
jgi:hypothetical protein